MKYPRWMAQCPDDHLRKRLDDAQILGIGALNGIKHHAIREGDRVMAFYASQRLLAMLYHADGKSDAFLDMLIDSMEACVQSGLAWNAIAQGKLANELLQEKGRVDDPTRGYVLYTMVLEHLDLKCPEEALVYLRALQEMTGWEIQEEAGLKGLVVEALLMQGEQPPDICIRACEAMTDKVLLWGSQAAKYRDQKEMEQSFDYCGHALNLCLQTAIVAQDADFGLRMVYLYRGMLRRLYPRVATLHTPDTSANLVARESLGDPHSFVDCIRFEDGRHKQQVLVFYQDDRGMRMRML